MANLTPARYPGAALVTGASSGIGEAYARGLAARGFPLVLVARNRSPLEALASELMVVSGVPVEVVAADLSSPEGPASVRAATDALGLDVSVLVNNAGVGNTGDLVAADRERLLRMVDLNCRAVLDLCTLYTPDMARRQNGAVFITSSMAGYQACPFMAAYGATKAFDLSLGEALWAELHPYGVDVLAVSPGFTETGFARQADITVTPPGPTYTPEQVVEESFAALGRGPSHAIGRANRLSLAAARLLTRRQMTRMVYRLSQGEARVPRPS